MARRFKPINCKDCGREYAPKGPRSRRCPACQKHYAREYARNWLERNKERIHRYQYEWCANNTARNRENKRRWMREHHEKAVEWSRKWRAANPEKHKAHLRCYQQTPKGRATQRRAKAKRKSRVAMTVCDLTAEQWAAILEEHNYRCAYCGKDFDMFRRPTQDHITPIFHKGQHTKANILPACKPCNSSKGTKAVAEGVRERGIKSQWIT